MATTVKRYSLSKQVSDKIEKLIENNVYKIDEKIPTESILMEKFDVSRNTLREAIQSLVSLGLLEVRQGDGTYVRANNRLDATMKMILDGVKYQDINDVRKTLEVSIAYTAAINRNEEDLINIEKALNERQTQTDNEKENTILDINFHIEIAKASHNQLLLQIYKSLYSFLIINIQHRKIKTNMSNEEIDNYHKELYLAIKSKDGELAKDYARKILNI